LPSTSPSSGEARVHAHSAGDLSSAADGVLGHPRLHLRRTDSTNQRARALALAGAPHGTLVTAAEQTAGRGRQGRAWLAPAGSSLLCSLVLRPSGHAALGAGSGCAPPIFDRPPALLSLAAGMAVCDTVGEPARVKWPNDVVVGPRLAKLAGILIEGRPQERWAVLGIGINVALQVDELPPDVRQHAASLELASSAIEPLLTDLLAALARRLAEPPQTLLELWRGRDALRGREISWGSHSPTQHSATQHSGTQPSDTQPSDAQLSGTQPSDTQPSDAQLSGLCAPARSSSARPGLSEHVPIPAGRGRADGIDDDGRLLVRLRDGTTTALSAGEVHLRRSY
jgi:BirA family biotin operon repressor/biotin-[acetyl-CoA-carboxylase] ligase